ncbi:MAG TPA: ABC transporter substrate-binding protein [Solirubrobacterales bacterium]|nr:ABC transporter substrate-binding protein [Solirubrobacterales bacterium]
MRGLKQWRLLIAAAGLVLVLGLAACGGDDDDDGGGGEAQLDLVIGDSLPLTGDLSDFGPPGQKASDLAVSEINKAIQQAGVEHTVKVVHEDNETSPQAAVQAARKLVDSDGASCITGAWASSDTIPTAQSVSIPDGVLQISPASTSDEITALDDDGLVNRTSPPDSFQGPTLANTMDAALGGANGKTVNIGARNDSYGTGLAGTFGDAWKELGGSVGQEVIYDPEQPSYDSEAGQITSGNPDAIVIIDFPETFVKVGPALQRTGNWDPSKGWFTDGLASGDVPDSVDAQVIDGMRGTAPGSPDKGEASTAFDDLYTSSDPRDVDRQTFDTQNFDATILCYLAAVAAGSTDGQDMADQIVDVSAPPGAPYTWEQLPEAIKALQNGDDIDYQGASGQIDLDDAGDATAGVYDIYTFKGATLTLDEIGETPVVLPE